MIHFNELRVSSDSNYLIIDTEIDSDSYFNNIILANIAIDTQDTYISSGPSSRAIYNKNLETIYDNVYAVPENCNCNPVLDSTDLSYCFTYNIDSQRHIRLFLSAVELGVNLDTTMLFVYVTASGTPAADTPCGWDNNQILGTVLNLKTIYNKTMDYIKQIDNNCSIPKSFIDMILRIKAVDLSVRTGNYVLAIKYWKKFFSTNISNQVDTTNCGCNG